MPLQTRDLALAHYADRQKAVNAAAKVAAGAWAGVNPARLVDSWAAAVPEVAAAVTAAQRVAARQANGYLDDLADAEDFDEATALVDPSGFAGIDWETGHGLLGILTNPVFVTLTSIQDGHDIITALFSGGHTLDRDVRTAVADAGRLADQAATAARPGVDGYIRMAVGNTCARCMILSGQFYRYNAAFQRHPRCDCTQVPANGARAARVPGARSIYDRMTTAERQRAGFSLADQRAISEGASLESVTNAKRGMTVAGGRGVTTVDSTTRRGIFGGYRLDPETGKRVKIPRQQGARTDARLTPAAIYERYPDRGDAVRALADNGYLTEVPAPFQRPSIALAAEPAPRAALPTPRPGGASSTPAPALVVRPALANAPDVAHVEFEFSQAMYAITGKRPRQIKLGRNLETAREHAEGLLRCLERFPDANLEIITTQSLRGTRYAEAQWNEIRFATRYTNDRPGYLASVAEDARQQFHPAGTGFPAGIAIHEFGHVLDIGTLGTRARKQIDEVLADISATTGIPVDRVIEVGVSKYALESRAELVAEAFCDVIMNGDAASVVSRRIFDALDEVYHAPGSNHRGITAIAPPVSPARAAPSVPAAGRAAASGGFEARAGAASEGVDALLAPPWRMMTRTRPPAGHARDVYDAVRSYPRGASNKIGRLLRGRDVEDAAKVRETVGLIDEAMAGSHLDREIVVWRGQQSADAIGPSAKATDLTGFEWTDPGFLGTTAKRDKALEFAADEDAVLMRILAPRDTPALQLTDIDHEAEVLLGRGLRYRVVQDRGVVNGRRTVDVEVVPATPPTTAAAGPVKIDRSASPESVLTQEAAAQAQALAAPPVKLEDLMARAPNGQRAKALRYYQRHGDEHMNGLLRRGKVGRAGKTVPTEDAVRKSIGQLDAVMADSQLTEAITVYRGVADAKRLLPTGRADMTGFEFTDAGFTSTSAQRSSAEQFLAGEGMATDGVLLEVHVPPGVGAVQISNDTFLGASPDKVSSEREVLLQRGLTFRVTSDTRRPQVYRRGADAVEGDVYRHVVVEVVPVSGAAGDVAEDLTKLGVTQLRARAQALGLPVRPGTGKADLVRVLSDPNAAKREAARARQALVDAAAKRADALSTLQEAARAGTVRDELRTVAELKALPAADLAALTKAADDPAKFAAALDRITRKYKLTPTAAAGEVLPMREGLQVVGGRPIAEGTEVVVARRGTEMLGPSGERIVIEPPQVREFTAADRAQVRQAAIDSNRGVADALAEVARLVDKGAELTTVVQRFEAALRRGKVPDGPAVAAIRRAIQGGDPRRILRAVDQGATKIGLTPGAEKVGDLVTVNGETARVVAPGYTIRHAGETIPVAAPITEALSAADLAALRAEVVDKAEAFLTRTAKPTPAALRREGLTVTAKPSRTAVPFDPTRYEVRGPMPAAGAKVRVVEPGYTVRAHGQDVIVRRPVVEAVVPPTRARAATSTLRRDTSAKVTPREVLDADLRRMTDDELLDRFHVLSSQDTLDEAALASVDRELTRRETGGVREPDDVIDIDSPTQRRIDELMAQGRTFESAAAEVYDLDEDAFRREVLADLTDGQRALGESRDAAVRRLYEEKVYRQWVGAEQWTRGNLLNRAGQARGIDPKTLFSGPRATARKYASEELKRYWDEVEARETLEEFRARTLRRASDMRRVARRATGHERDFGL